MYQRSLGIVRGQRAALLPPVESMEGLWSEAEQLAMAERMALMVVGGPQRVREALQQIIDATQADELILVSDAYNPEDRLKSFDLWLGHTASLGPAVLSPPDITARAMCLGRIWDP